ncbi:MAG: sulfurtransferase-like selenium metabolism protein YedF [Thermodesulfobacteriota bacterium]
MREKILECQGLPCPQPVLQCKQVIDSGYPGTIKIIVDNQPARENVCRFLGSQGYEIVNTEEKEGQWTITSTAGDKKDASNTRAEAFGGKKTARPTGERKTLVFITQDKIGHGDDELGTKLMHNFLATLPETGDELWRVILLNGAVRLALKDSPTLDSLKNLLNSGVSLLVCGTCLDFFQLLEQKEVGETTNMLDVVTSLQLADKVISL